MKRIGLLVLAIVMVLGVAGCNKNKDADPVGTWVVAWDNGCDGTYANLVMHIFDNGTFIDDEGDRGNWTVNRNDVTLNYTTFPAVVAGDIDGDRMTGTFSGTYNGCFAAQRTSTSP